MRLCVRWFVVSAWSATGIAVAGCSGKISDSATVASTAGASSSQTGGAQATGGSAEGSESPGRESGVPRVKLRRLSQTELDRSIEAIFLDDTKPATRLLSEEEYSPFDNDYTLQDPSSALISSLDALAEDVAERFVADENRRDEVMPCAPLGAEDQACLRQFATEVGARVLRRPVTDADLTPWMALHGYAVESEEGVENGFYTAVALIIRVWLQDPEFLYRVEMGQPSDVSGVFDLEPYEIATRMSLLLWAEPPDEALLKAAADGDLQLEAGRRQVAAVMLEDERAREQLRRFHSMWLGYRAIPHTAELVEAFARETNALIDRVVFEDQASYMQLFQAEETYVDGMLAEHYGLPAPDGGGAWVPYGDTGRAGILSHGSVLAAFSKFSDTSPTQRGIFVRTRLMCDEISPPPPQVDVDQPPGQDDALCKYDRYSQHRAVTSCASCHDGMDPIGFGLERFDVGGRLREHDDGLPECSIDGVGNVPGLGEFSGPQELSNLLIEAQEIDDCFVRQFYQFAIGRQLLAEDALATDRLLADFRRSDHRLSDLLLNYVSSSEFAQRREDAR